MSRQREREDFLAQLHAAGVPLDAGRRLLAYGTTLRRLAEAQCNGDWPADNGQREVAPCGGAEGAGCGLYWVPSQLKGKGKVCPDCWATAKVGALVAEYGLTALVHGDPRGCVLSIDSQDGRQLAGW